jgi:predicted nucleic acid-binding Zn ribbon protein
MICSGCLRAKGKNPHPYLCDGCLEAISQVRATVNREIKEIPHKKPRTRKCLFCGDKIPFMNIFCDSDCEGQWNERRAKVKTRNKNV